jgi:aminoglycoside phosphotransferase family enzyme
MDLTSLIEALADKSAYPVPAAVVSVHQTHISVVFLVGLFAYKSICLPSLEVTSFPCLSLF